MPEMVTKDQIKSLIKSENLKPSDLFSADQIISDPVTKGFADEKVKERIGSEYQHRKKAEEELDKLKKDFEEKEKKYQDENKTLKLDAAKTQTGTLFEKQKVERKLDDRQIKFIQKRLDRFNPSTVEKVDEEFNKFLDSEIDEYKVISKDVFGIESDDKDNDDKDKIKGEPDRKSQRKPENKYTDPEKNPFIKTDSID